MKSKLSTETGIIPMRELKASPGYPSEKRLNKGPVAVIECTDEIPCDPCETVCRRGAIKVGSPITNLPRIIEDKCDGCGLCISICPGLAIFIVDNTYSEREATVSFPYEYLPLPKEGLKAKAVNRKGKVVCEARVVKIRNPKKFDHTPVITIAIPKRHSGEVRGIKMEFERKSTTK